MPLVVAAVAEAKMSDAAAVVVDSCTAETRLDNWQRTVVDCQTSDSCLAAGERVLLARGVARQA